MQRHKPTRFEVELRELHGDDFDFVEVKPRAYALPPSITRIDKVKAWWKRQPKLEKVWIVWLWSLLLIVGSTLGVITAAILSAHG